MRLRPNSGVNLRTYGMEFVASYFPYYQQGECYARTGDPVSAIRMFNIEEKQGAIKGNRPLYAELQRLRDLAQTKVADETAAVDRQARVKRAAEDVERLRREGGDLHRRPLRGGARAPGRGGEGGGAAGARRAAADRGPGERIRADVNDRDRADGAQHARIEQGLAEGRRLLDAGRAAEARIAVRGGARAGSEERGRAGRRARGAGAHPGGDDAAAARRRPAPGQGAPEAGQYEQALRAAHGGRGRSRGTWRRRRSLKRVQAGWSACATQKDVRVRIDALLADGERLIGADSTRRRR